MAREGHIDIQPWVVAELAGNGADADRLFGGIVRSLPRRAAPDGLADRVARTLDWEDRASRATVPRSRSARVAAMAVLGVVGAGAAVLGVMALAPFFASRLLTLLNFSARGFVWLVQAFEGGLDAWAVLASAGRAIGSAIAAPRVAVSFVVLELIGVAALYALHRLLRLERETSRG